MLAQNNQPSKTQKSSETPSLHSNIILPLIVVAIVALIVGLCGGYLLFANNKRAVSDISYQSQQNSSTIAQEIPSNSFIGSLYNVKIPGDFYIFYRYGDDFAATSKKWEGSSEFYPSVGVSTYIGDIPSGMKVREWLEKVGRTQDWSEFTNTNIPCKASKESLRKENEKTPYGGSDGKLLGDECLFFNIKNVREITLPNIKNDKFKFPSNLEIIEFNSSGSSTSGSEGTYTLITFGTGAIIQIDMKKTSKSVDGDGIEKAYQMLKDSIKL